MLKISIFLFLLIIKVCFGNLRYSVKVSRYLQVTFCEIYFYNSIGQLITLKNPIASQKGLFTDWAGGTKIQGRPEYAIDGNNSTSFYDKTCQHTPPYTNETYWWQVDFESVDSIEYIMILFRNETNDKSYWDDLDGADIEINGNLVMRLPTQEPSTNPFRVDYFCTESVQDCDDYAERCEGDVGSNRICERCKTGMFYEPNTNTCQKCGPLVYGSSCTESCNSLLIQEKVPNCEIIESCSGENGLDIFCEKCHVGFFRDSQKSCLPCSEYFDFSNNYLRKGALFQDADSYQTFTNECFVLDFKNKAVHSISDNTFTDMPHIQSIDLTGNPNLNRLSYGLFDYIPTMPLNTKYDPVSGLNLDIEAKCSVIGFTIENGLLKRKEGNTYNYMPECTYLDISNSSITNLDENAFEMMSKLTHLDLTLNNITVIPYDVFDTVPKDSLVLDNQTKCSIYAFTLTANGTLIRKTSADYNYVPGCTKLRLENANIRYLEKSAFRDLNVLTSISFHKNLLTNVSAAQFGNLFFDNGEILNVIDLSFNIIPKVEAFSFQFCKQLLKLNISNSQIENLEEDAFTFSDNLNSIDTFPTIELKNNNLDCCSNMVELNKLVSYNQNVTCLVNDLNKIDVEMTGDTLHEKCFEGLPITNNSGKNKKIGLIVGLVVVTLCLIGLTLVIYFYISIKKAKKDLLQGKSAMAFVMEDSIEDSIEKEMDPNPNPSDDYDIYDAHYVLGEPYSAVDANKDAPLYDCSDIDYNYVMRDRDYM